MADDYYSLLGILSPEAEAVRETLSAGRRATPEAVYGSPHHQAYADYSRAAEEAQLGREELAYQAEVQRRIALPTMGGRAARGSAYREAMEAAMYEKQAKALLDDLQLLDPADPEALTMQDEVIAKHPIARKAMSDPRVASIIRRQSKEHEEMQELFENDPDSLAEYTRLRSEAVEPTAARQQVHNSAKRRAERIWFASNGGDPAEFDSGKFNGPDGRPDKAKMAHYLSTRKAQEDSLLSSTERKALDKAVEEFEMMSGVNPDDENTKTIAFRSKFGRDPDSEEDWATAYRMVSQSGLAEREALAALILDFERAGKAVPDLYKKMVGVGQAQGAAEPTAQQPSASPAQPSQPSPNAPVLVNTRAEWEALPAGTRYMDKKGNLGTKK